MTPKETEQGAGPLRPGGEADPPQELEERFFEDGAAAAAPPDDGEVDPELLQLPRRRKRRHPLIGLLVIGLSLYLLYFVRADILFFFQPRTPEDVGPVAQALREGRLRTNRHVRVTGAPDRKHALLLEGRVSGYDNFFRLKEGGGRVFVQRHRFTRLSDKEVSAVHAGQVVPFDSLPYSDSLRRYLGKAMTLAHELDFDEVARAKAAGASRLQDRQGAAVPLAEDSVLWINAAFPGEWVVQFSQSVYAEAAQAEALLAPLGLPFAADAESSRMFWRFVVLADPAQAEALIKRFADRKLRIGVVRRQLSYSARWDQLRVEGRALLVDALDPTFPARYTVSGAALVASRPKVVRLPAEAILFITASSPYVVPPDAVVILADRAPGDNWYYALLLVLLTSFIAINLVILVGRLRAGKEAAR